MITDIEPTEPIQRYLQTDIAKVYFCW